MSTSAPLKIFGGRANEKLTLDICKAMSSETTPFLVGEREIKQFADDELWMQYTDNIRGSDVFIIQPTCAPVNDNLMELMLMINAAKLASAKRVTAVIPYFGYARQDRKDRPRTPLSAKVVASMLQSQHIKRVLTMDLHSAPIQGFFDIPVDHLLALPVLIDHLKTNNLRFKTDNEYGILPFCSFSEHLTIVSPDAGGVARARHLSMKLSAELKNLGWDKFHLQLLTNIVKQQMSLKL